MQTCVRPKASALPLLSGRYASSHTPAHRSPVKLPAGYADTQGSLVLGPSGLKMQAPASPPGRSFGSETSVAGVWEVFSVCLRQRQDYGLDPVKELSNQRWRE